jgi:hypothetical protein
MMDSCLREAFDQVCENAKQAESWYVVLMERVPFYGGPEEGGWYGNDNIVQAYKEYPSEELAQKAADQVHKLAQELSQNSLRQYGDQCLREMGWLGARGLDADYLPEPDGPSEFYVLVTQNVPENIYGGRQWS